MPEVAQYFQKIMLLRFELNVLSVIHAMCLQHLIYFEKKNEWGCGPIAMKSMSGRDRSQCHVLSRGFKDFLFDLAHKVTSGCYFNHSGKLHSFKRNVTQEDGSVITILNGIKIKYFARYWTLSVSSGDGRQNTDMHTMSESRWTLNVKGNSIYASHR